MFAPDGGGTQIVLWVLAAICLAALTFFGHHIGGRHPGHMVGRFLGTLATALVMVVAVTASLNAHYGWYTSWQDLSSTASGAELEGTVKNYGATSAPGEAGKPAAPAVLTYDEVAAERINAQADIKFASQRAAWERSAHLVKSGPEGQWIDVHVTGLSVNGRNAGRVRIWLPQSYLQHPNRTYPVIQAFHGMPGGTLDYQRVFQLDQAIVTAVSEKKMRESIVVIAHQMPDGVDTECVDGGGINMETWLTKNVPDWVISHLRVKADPNSWTAMGVSAGGYCASMAGLLHPDRYAGIVSLGGYFKPIFGAWNPFNSSGLPARYDLTAQVSQHPNKQAMWILISGADKLSGHSSETFANAVKAPMMLTTMDYPNAGHRTDVWSAAFPDVFSWLGKTLPAFAPIK